MSKILIIQGSLNKESKTSIVTQTVKKHCKEKKIEHEYLDLRDLDLQFCDGRDLEEYNEDMQNAAKLIEEADAYIIGMPVYQYSLSGVLKNFIDIVSDGMEEKPIGICTNSGGPLSYLASRDLMILLSFEVGSICVQPTVFTHAGSFEDGKIKDEKVFEKIEDMVENLIKHIK